MSKFGFAGALLALVSSSATLLSAAYADDVCQNPSFSIATGSPFKLRTNKTPLPPQTDTQPVGLAAGTYTARAGVQPGKGCGCDLAVAVLNADNTSGFLALMQGNENGSFTLVGQRDLGGIPGAVATGRFRTDSVVDGIVAITSSSASSGGVAVFVPDPNGQYPQTPSETFPTGANPVAITTGDFNGDGLLDAAVINKGNSSLTILLGTGRGSFANPPITVPLGGVPESVAAGKFSGTSAADDVAIGVLLTVGASSQVGFVIVPGNRDRTYTAKSPVAIGQVGSNRSSIAAANLSAPQDTTGQRRWRDLAITFTDLDQTGTPVGRVKVLHGRDQGDFDVSATQTLELGNVLPRSIKVADLDNDGVVDLVVSSHGDSAANPDGTFHFFQGHAAPASPVGFQPKQGWNTITQRDVSSLPRALVAGPFGKLSPSQSTASMGLAAINDPGLNSIIVLQGNGQGAFTQPSLVTTVLGDDDHMFVSGDFHSLDGSKPLQDLAFLTKANGKNVVRVMQADGGGGFAQPDPSQPLLQAGDSPSLMVPGRFDPTKGTGLALIDDTGAVGQKPLLKIVVSQGNGVLKPATELPLPNVGKPRAMVTGHFQNPDTLDLALVSATATTGSSQASGVLTLLLNKGNNTFEIGSSTPLQFVPAAIATSTRLSGSGRSDVVIRDANAARFLFLINIDNGNFRPAKGGSSLGFFTGAGSMQTLLVGNVMHKASEMLDDVVTFDEFGSAIQVFVNQGDETFKLSAFNSNNPAGATFLQLADFGSGTAGLASPTILDQGKVGLQLLQTDGNGGLVPSTGLVTPQAPQGTRTSMASETDFPQQTAPVTPFKTPVIQLKQTVVAQFRSALHGNSLPDFALISQASETDGAVGNCPGDHTPTPPPSPKLHAMVCPTASHDQGCPPEGCFFPCCRCNSIGTPKAGRCPTTCDFPEPVTPFQPYCKTTMTFTQAISVFGNNCGD